ncbi:MAG: hypothetical protein HYX55_06040 [Chloroflexi bacterium]|nr:hypothetical protein [Chloroflexota bacterium]
MKELWRLAGISLARVARATPKTHARPSSMPSLKRTLAITGALLVMATLAPVASAGTERAFYLDKTCAEDLSEPLGYICTVEHSDFKWIPAGTEIRYLSQVDNVVQARIEIANGSVEGACTWSSDVDAVCVFGSGTGRLAAFHLDVVVTANGDASIWYWDGMYWFGN